MKLNSPVNRFKKCFESLWTLLNTLLTQVAGSCVTGKTHITSKVAVATTGCFGKGLQSSGSEEPAVSVHCTLGSLPETLKAEVLEFCGPLAWLHASRANAEMHCGLWEAPLVWSHALSNLGVDPRNPERDFSCSKDTYRQHFFGIDSFCLQPAVGSACVCEVSLDLLRQALKACRGLDISDGSVIITSVATKAASLFQGFAVDDVDAQREAQALAEIVEKRADVFNDEQRAEVAIAFKEAMDYKQLMEDAKVSLDSNMMQLDMEDQWENAELWSQVGFTCASEEGLDFLIAALKESCAEGAVSI